MKTPAFIQSTIERANEISRQVQRQTADAIFSGERLTGEEGENEKQRRLSICEACPKFDPDSRKCTACGCFMDVKAGLKTHLEISTMQYEVTHCPEGRWGKAEINGQEIDYFEIANYYKKQKGEDPIKPNKDGLEETP